MGTGGDRRGSGAVAGVGDRVDDQRGRSDLSAYAYGSRSSQRGLI